MRSITMLLALAVAGFYPAAASAQVGKLLLEGVKAARKGSAKVAREGVEEGSEQSAARLAIPLVIDHAGQPAKALAAPSVAEEAAELVWQHKGSIAVGTVATAALLKPEEFIRAGEHVATKALDVTGSSLVRPLVEGTTEHVAKPVAQEFSREAARAIPWRLVVTLGLLFGLAWWGWRWLRRRLSLV